MDPSSAAFCKGLQSAGSSTRSPGSAGGFPSEAAELPRISWGLTVHYSSIATLWRPIWGLLGRRGSSRFPSTEGHPGPLLGMGSVRGRLFFTSECYLAWKIPFAWPVAHLEHRFLQAVPRAVDRFLVKLASRGRPGLVAWERFYDAGDPFRCTRAS